MPTVPLKNELLSVDEVRNLIRDGAIYSDEQIQRWCLNTFYCVCPEGQSTIEVEAKRLTGIGGYMGIKPSLTELEQRIMEIPGREHRPCLQETIAMLNTERDKNNQLQQENNGLQRRNDDLEHRNDDLERRNDDLEHRNDDLERRNDDLQRRNDDLNKGMIFCLFLFCCFLLHI